MVAANSLLGFPLSEFLFISCLCRQRTAHGIHADVGMNLAPAKGDHCAFLSTLSQARSDVFARGISRPWYQRFQLTVHVLRGVCLFFIRWSRMRRSSVVVVRLGDRGEIGRLVLCT